MYQREVGANILLFCLMSLGPPTPQDRLLRNTNEPLAPACVARTQSQAVDEDGPLLPPPAAFAAAAATEDVVTAPAAAAAGMDSEVAAPSHAAEVVRPTRPQHTLSAVMQQ